MIKRKMKGFTLVETIIVIAVIAILSSILIPTFGNVIKDASETKYKSEASTAVREYYYRSDKTDYKTALVLYFKDGKDGSTETATRAYIAEGVNLGDCLTTAPSEVETFITSDGENTFKLDVEHSGSISDAYDDSGKLVQLTDKTLYWISDNVALAILTK